MCKVTRIAILPLTYKYPSLFIGLKSLIEIAGKQIEFPNIMWEPVPDAMELGKKSSEVIIVKVLSSNVIRTSAAKYSTQQSRID